MSENKIGIALVHEICPICGKPMNEQILMNSVLSKKYAKEIENVHGKAIGYSKTACEDCSKYKDEAVKCIYTYSINEWKHIIKLRSDSAAHPNAQIISNMIKKELESLGYEFN